MSNQLKNQKDLPIGIFDSGVGGLTVVKELIKQLPHESIIYFGDTARYPYGTRSSERILALAKHCSSILLEYGVKYIIIACNTASSIALNDLQENLDVPVIGVVKPGAAMARERSKNKKIGIIGTSATIGSESYQKELLAFDNSIEPIAKACPLFVALAEEGWTEGQVPALVAEEYLAEIRNSGVDTLILGCTHYPLLKTIIGKTMGEKVSLIDSAEAAVNELAANLAKNNTQRDKSKSPVYRYLVSDSPDRFRQIGENFLGRTIPEVFKVILE